MTGREQLYIVENIEMMKARLELQEASPLLEIPPFIPDLGYLNMLQGLISPSTTTKEQATLLIKSQPTASNFVELSDNNSVIPPDTHGSAWFNHGW